MMVGWLCCVVVVWLHSSVVVWCVVWCYGGLVVDGVEEWWYGDMVGSWGCDVVGWWCVAVVW